MSKSEMTSQGTLEQTPTLPSEDTQYHAATPGSRTNQSLDPDKAQTDPYALPTAIKDGIAPEPLQKLGSAASYTLRDLNRIIAHAREDIAHLREKQASYQEQIEKITQERDEIEQRYSHLRENYEETMHINAEEKIRRAAESLRETPGQIPQLFEPIQESITRWLANQQAEREAVLQQKLETVEHQAAIIRKELIAGQEALAAAREKFAQERQMVLAQMKTRETWLQHRWVVKAWGTAAVMFLVLPAFQAYLLIEKASTLNIIIIPTVTCLVLTALINLVRARKRPSSKTSAEKDKK